MATTARRGSHSNELHLSFADHQSIFCIVFYKDSECSSRLKPPLGTYKDGQPDKEKKANKSAEGKAAFRLSIFNRPRIVNAGPRI